MRKILFAGLIAPALVAALATPAAAEPLSSPAAHDDFNGDGYRDLVVSAPDATIGGYGKAGYVAVLYGSSSGLSTSNRKVISQNTTGVIGGAESGDRFGQSVASGDFDSDGHADLAVGIPGEDIGTVTDAGGVTVLWGSSGGLTGESTWFEEEVPTAQHAYGRGLATGDFQGTGSPQLAVLSTQNFEYWYWESATSGQAAMSTTARSAAREQQTTEATVEVTVDATGLTAGDYDNNGHADLVILGTLSDGTTTEGWAEYWSGDPSGLTYVREFAGGPVGTTGDINHDGHADLVTAYPTQKNASGQDTTGGTVKVWYGGANGPTGQTGPDDAQQWTQASPGVPGTAESGDRWGSDLSVNDVNGDGYGDVAIGADGENIGTTTDAGAVSLLRGSADGLTATGAQSYHQNSANVPGSAEAYDRFGGQMRLIDANRDGRAGLIASAPGENTNDGYAWVFSGTSSGLTASGSWTFNGSSLAAPTADARFGAAIAE